MKKKRKGKIYKATSPSGKVYIGQTICNVKKRISEHIKNSNNERRNSYNTKMSQAIRKYGNEMVWEVIEENISFEDLDKKERDYISFYDSYRSGYNSTPGGSGEGKETSEETKRILSEINKGKRLSKETRKKISKALKGKMAGEKNPMYGRGCSEEEIKRRSLEWIAFDPDDNKYEFYSLRRFCREKELHFWHMCNVADKKENQHKGWLVYRAGEYSKKHHMNERLRQKKSYMKLISPIGDEYIVTNIQKFCLKNNLNTSCIINVAKKRQGRTQHKGWKAEYIYGQED